MQKRHLDRKKYFTEQNITTSKYVIPFVKEKMSINKATKVLEIGCGEGGNLLEFCKVGCAKIVGVDISQKKINKSEIFLKKYKNNWNLELICNDFYNIKVKEIGKFDLIIMRDVLEHVEDQNKFMKHVKLFMKSDSFFFLGFPPWVSPFGGHQQICNSKFLSKLPYFHLLPRFIYVLVLSIFNESKEKVDCLLAIRNSRVSIERFEKILRIEGFKKEKVIYYLINPNYEVKFGLKPLELPKGISFVPMLREFFITTSYYLLSKE